MVVYNSRLVSGYVGSEVLDGPDDLEALALGGDIAGFGGVESATGTGNNVHFVVTYLG